MNYLPAWLPKAVGLFLFLLMAPRLEAQLIDGRDPVKVTLPDQLEVWLLKGYQQPLAYYYLPAQLRISTLGDSVPEFSFIAFREDDEGPISGALLHMLLTWGLTPAQEEAVTHWLKTEVDTNALLVGHVPVVVPEGQEHLVIEGENPLVEVFRSSLRSQGTVPNYAGGKVALSFLFDAGGAVQLDEALKEPRKLKDIQFRISLDLNPIEFYGPLHIAVRQSMILEGAFKQWMQNLNPEK